jgi:hypothetical protein
MRTRLQHVATTPQPTWNQDDDDTFNRTRAALNDAIAEVDLPEGILEDTVKIVRLPYDY